MTDFQNISNSLNQEEHQRITISVVSLGGVTTNDIDAGTTVADFKARYGLTGKKLVNEEGDALSNDTVLSSDMQLFVSTPKQNG